MNSVIGNLRWKEAMVYIDDVIIWAKNFKQLLHRLRNVLERLSKAGIKLNAGKCEFAKSQIVYLGHQISKHGISPYPGKVKAIKKLPMPQTLKALRSFIGLMNYYQMDAPTSSAYRCRLSMSLMIARLYAGLECTIHQDARAD